MVFLLFLQILSMKIKLINKVLFAKKSILILLAFIACQLSFAGTWYVSTSGNDTLNGKSPVFVSGSLGPMRNINTALGAASSGDTVFLGSGYFGEHITLTTKNIYFQVSNTVVKSFTIDGASLQCYINGSTGNFFDVVDTFNLSKGFVIVPSGGAQLRLIPGCIALGGSSTSFVDGKYYIGVSGSAPSINFHHGDLASTDYRNAKLSFNKSGSDTVFIGSKMVLGVAPVSGTLPLGIRNISAIRYFHLTSTKFAGLSNFNLNLGYDFQNINDEAFDSAKLSLVMHKGTGNWISLAGKGTTNNAGTLYNTNNADTLAYFTYANDSLGTNVLGTDEVFAIMPNKYEVCLGETVNFSQSSLSVRQPITSYFWDFGDLTVTTDTSSLQFPSFTYSDSGNYTVKMIVMNALGNKDSAYATVRVNALPKVNFGFTEVCKGLLTTFTDSSSVASPDAVSSHNWSFGNGGTGTGPVVNYPYSSASNYTVRLVVATLKGCIDSADKLVRVYPKPYVDFPTPSSCVNDSATFLRFKNTNPPDNQITYSWFIDGNFYKTDTVARYKFITPGVHTAKMVAIASNGCKDSTTKNFTIQYLPVPNFVAPSVCVTDTASFLRVRNTLPAEALLSWKWKINGVAASTDTAFKKKFATAGFYTVTLIGTSIQGCQDSIAKSVTIHALPTPDFITSDVCLSDTAYFNRIANINPPDNLITWSWKADGAAIAGTIASKKKFATAGTHSISLYGISNVGCRDSITKTLTVYGLPSVGFVLDPAIAGNTQTQCLKNNKFTSFPTLSASQGQTIVAATWKWGDGNFDLLKDSTHSYASTGNYTVRLIATTDRGCTDSVSNTYRVRGTLNVNFNKIGNCVPDSIIFNDSAVSASSAIASRMWKVNGTNAAAVSPAKIYFNGTGPYTVTYTITTAEGCTDSVSKNVSFTTYPNLTFALTGTSPFCVGDSISVKANGGTNIIWLNDNDTNRTKVFKSSIRYTVRAFNGPLCYVDDNDTVLVYPKASVTAYSDTTIYRGSSAILRATGATTYTWSPATGLSATTGATVRSSTVQTRRYIVSGTNGNGCSDQDTVTVTVIDPVFTRIPNIITPNGDNENDAWDVKELADLDQYDLTVTDYSGKVVYESSNYQNDWKAVDKSNNDLPDGIYYYLLHHRGNHSKLKGFIQVIR